MKALTRANGQRQHRENGEKPGSYRWHPPEAAQYEVCSYPLALALVEDPKTGVPRAASHAELLSLGLTGPKFETEMREIFQ